ncbi:hypothetical protein LR48_Vigan843s002000 [Vigna angularis]|uniref:Uncharacterized protein n=1 Tax=Phaseolus angularis TaxID=3914 RepID=A0A0L9TH90_PHAAN|nr:hypothetical protein LR48_Vigan843s002000 [Vigna angularis]
MTPAEYRASFQPNVFVVPIGAEFLVVGWLCLEKIRKYSLEVLLRLRLILSVRPLGLGLITFGVHRQCSAFDDD